MRDYAALGFHLVSKLQHEHCCNYVPTDDCGNKREFEVENLRIKDSAMGNNPIKY
jgi:hypothetical protein